MYHDILVTQFSKMLKNLLGILEKGAAFADGKKIDFEVLLTSRLAPDQFPLTRQIQMVCDTAKFGASRISGKDAPAHADNEKTLSEVRQRIESVIAYLQTYSPKDFEKGSTNRVSQPRWEGQYLTGEEYLLQHVIPNFYFHLTTAYSILRHNGVDVGKRDYLGPMPLKK